jgi:DNA-binding NtrC family response regulator
MRVGGIEPIKVDVRVIAATNRNLPEAVKEGKFREDLYYRLNVIQINLPPLRERPGDVGDLVLHFTETIGGSMRGVSQEAMKALCAYSWPGNIRQLRNMMERTIILSANDELQLEDFPDEIRNSFAGSVREPSLASVSAPSVQRVTHPFSPSSLADFETAHIRAVLEECGGNKKLAAERLGISRSTLYEKLRECTTVGHVTGGACPESGQITP